MEYWKKHYNLALVWNSDMLKIKISIYMFFGILFCQANHPMPPLISEIQAVIIFEEDLENDEHGWLFDDGWALTETSSNSPTHSIFSPNNDVNQNSNHYLRSSAYTLPGLGLGETMHFSFWLNASMPDSDGNDDGILEDYYSIALQDMTSFAWHGSSFNMDVGSNFWCGHEEISGYENAWLQYMDTPSILVGNDGVISARMYYLIEDDEAPFEVEDSCTNGWDSANIRISSDGGETWELLVDPLNPYHFDCGYGWIYNDEEYEEGGTLHHLAPGWSGNSNGWVDFSADLSSYAGSDVVIRFAFGSDPAWSTADDATLTGFQIDEINVSDASGTLYENDGSDESTISVSGEVWIDQFYDYGSCTDERPGCAGWEEYVPGLAFNGNVFMDISDFAGKDVVFRFQSRYDDTQTTGVGEVLFIDDFKIYKISGGNYPAPHDVAVEAGDSQATLSWHDMNASGMGDFIFDNDNITNGIQMSTEGSTAFAGERIDLAGP